jgi:hypothetical protein
MMNYNWLLCTLVNKYFDNNRSEKQDVFPVEPYTEDKSFDDANLKSFVTQ